MRPPSPDPPSPSVSTVSRERGGEREGRREGGREGGRDGGKEGEREGEREGGREGVYICVCERKREGKRKRWGRMCE